MDEDLIVKAPVTRLRGRLSVDAEDSLPTTPLTPTKKRITRLAAKPQLELIDEVETENVPKKTTRKAAVKEAELDTNTGTPTRVTPSRRSTRIRSNTSILSETMPQNVESPRAKRALRRNSQLGSDTESAAITPARQTRRNRRDSTTSADKQGSDNESAALTPVRQTRRNRRDSTTSADKQVGAADENVVDNHSPSTRKSPRLQKNKGGKPDDGTDKAYKETDKKVNDSTQNTEETPLMTINDAKQIDIKIRACNLSTSAIEKMANDLKNKRNRTKSWTTLASSPANAGFISDNEGNKERIRRTKTPNTSITGSGDGLTANYGNKSPSKNVGEPDIKSPNGSINKSNSTLLNTSFEIKDNQFIKEIKESDTVKLFQNSPDNQQVLIMMEDSDADIQIDGEDQCVPVVANPTKTTVNKLEQSVEPMDIDESMPVNVTIDDFSDKSNTSKEEAEFPVNKIMSSLTEKSLLKDESHKSKKKSSDSIQSATETQKRFSIGDEVDNKNESINRSTKNSSMSSKDNPSTSFEEKLNDSTKYKSSSFSQINESRKSLNKSQRKSSVSFHKENKEKLNKSCSSVPQNNSEINQSVIESRKSLEKSPRKSSISIGEECVEKLNESKSKRKSSASEINQKSIEDENNESKTSNKSKRNSSISQSESQNLDKSGNASKSTLVISQLKDVSTNVTNNDMSPNVTNKELSKSADGADVKCKKIDKKNLSLNYLTSTPIHQKSLQKLTMQINTSIISPGVENKNKTIDNKPSKQNTSEKQLYSDETDEDNIKCKSTTSPINKLAKAASNSESVSGDEPDIKSKTQSVKKTKLPVLDSSDSSDEESGSKQQNNKEIPSKNLNNESKVVMLKDVSDCSESSYDSDEDVFKDKSKIVDDEASEASDDYESGDSQNEEDRNYEIENEIVEKGETLDSDEELSNNSDYEKDSFLVSSDAEDDEVLSGTGDDLSLSDNELTMAAKSKEKFNERKLKQQKKASREMYDARHEKDESANSSKSETTKSKKSKRQRLESSNLESENENTQHKKSNRLRIDSSQDRSMVKSDFDESIGLKNKNYKRLSESASEDITMNEKEITVCNQSSIENKDPLTVTIKKEPKTPQKLFNMSTVAINDNIEEVQVDSNASIMRQNETLDPLQATMAAEDSDDSSSSDNTEIIQNYDSVLNELSKQTKKIKTVDTSLNFNEKSKDSKDPIMDQLNLTQAKKSKINKNKTAKESSKVVVKEDEDSSDAIDMKLIFPEDSNDSEINDNHFKPQINKIPEGDFIPLKRTEAKTNIHENMDINESMNESTLNVSKKINKSKSLKGHCAPDEVPSKPDAIEEPEDSNIKIIIDTSGTHQELDTSAKTKNSSKKNKSFNKSKLSESAVGIDCTDGVVNTPVETVFTSEKKRKKNKNRSFDVSDSNVINSFVVTETQSETKKSNKKSDSTSEFVETHTENPEPEELPAATPEKKKKNKKNKEKVSQITMENTGEESDEAPVEMSYKSEKKSDVTDTGTIDALATSSEKKKHKKNKKKKKNKNLSQSIESPEENANSIEQDGDGAKNRKRKASGNTPTVTDIISVESATISNEKKKRKIYLDDEYVAAYANTEQSNEDGSKPKKPKKNKSKHEIVEQDEVPQHITKKRKNREDDSDEKMFKVPKENSFDKIHVPRLQESILNQLMDKPQNKTSKKTKAAIATMPFVVEEAERRKNKPSNYLEQSVYLNDSPIKTKQKRSKHKKPKVLPFIPTALTSDSGYTSKFNINVLPGEIKFVAQASNVENFRESFLGKQRIKKLGTSERFKKQRSHKISKF